MMALLETAEFVLTERPDRLIMTVEGLEQEQAQIMSWYAVDLARTKMPKATGRSASRLTPTFGPGFFGLKWQDQWTWYQENGIKPFTMYNLAGKTIPMWIDDPTGQERVKNPKAKTRITLSGKVQVLIFRRAAQKGQRKTKWRTSKLGVVTAVDVPMSYPGAPGRIAQRQAYVTDPGGKVVSNGQIARGNIGVRWRHPGLAPRLFLNNAMTVTAQRFGVLPIRIYVADSQWNARAR